MVQFMGSTSVLRGGLSSMFTGQNQATAFANARSVIEDITTTLRYAKTVTSGAGTITYTGPIDEITVNGYSKDKQYTRDISWDGSGDTLRLKIVKEDGSTTYFPANAANSAFSSEEYKTAFKNATGTEPSSGQIPIVENTTAGVYDVILPIKYKLSETSATKVDILLSAANVSNGIIAQTGGTIKDTTKDDKDKLAQQIGDILAVAVTNAYNNNPNIIKNGQGTFTSNISSVALHKRNYGDKLAGVSAQLWSTIPKDKQAIVGDTSWVIVPCDANDNFQKSGSKSVDHWKIFIARNVIDDVPIAELNYARLYDYTTINKSNRLKDSGIGMDFIQYFAEENGKYIIRPSFGFITYCFTTKGQTAVYETTDLDKTYGYATAIFNASIIYIDFNNWVPALGSDGKYTNYKNLKNYSGEYIEDINGTGKHYRLDYDGSGAEYTLDTEGSSYVYPGLLPDVPSDKTKW